MFAGEPLARLRLPPERGSSILARAWKCSPVRLPSIAKAAVVANKVSVSIWHGEPAARRRVVNGVYFNYASSSNQVYQSSRNIH